MAAPRCPACESPVIHQHFAKHGFGGNHVCGAVRKFPPRFDACNGAQGFDAAERRPSLHSRAGASLQPGRVSALRRGDCGCRARHSLHDQEQIPVHAGVPGVLQTRARSHGRTGRGRKAARHQAGYGAKTCQRKTVQIQKNCQAGRDLIAPWVRTERSRHYSDSVCSRKLPPLSCKANARRGRMRWELMPACKIARSLHQRPSRLAFRCAATHGVPQKPTPPINQVLRHN